MSTCSEHFAKEELACHCCGWMPDDGISDDLLALLESIRTEIGHEVEISCAARCEKHNAEVGGVPNSYHVQGLAADIIVPDGMTVDELGDLAEQCGADGIGRYYNDGFVHVDKRGYTARW